MKERQILFLAHRVPYPPDRGDRIRAWHLLRGLAKLGTVHVGALSDEPPSVEQVAVLDKVADSVCIARDAATLPMAALRAMIGGQPVSLAAFHSRSLARWVESTVKEKAIDTLFVFSGQMGQYVPSGYAGRLIVDLCDVDSAKFAQYAEDAAFPRNRLFRREARLLSAEEQRLVDLADVTTLISSAEKDRLTAPPKADARIEVLPNGVDADFFDPKAITPDAQLSSEEAYVFVGQMDYPPNVAAVQRFAEHVLPALRQRSDARFHIVGRDPTAAVRRLGERAGITVHGAVADVRPYVAAARAIVVPLTLARGVQNKVLEAMAMAKPVLLSPQAATGIGGRDGLHYTVCDDDEDFVAAAMHLNDTGAAARTFVLDRFSWSSMHVRLAQLVEGSEAPRPCSFA